MIYTEIPKDLFTTDIDFVWAHCISLDCKMGAGIADTFNKKFPAMKPMLLKQPRQIGDALPYTENERLIVNLITKENFWHKPTRNNFENSLRSLKKVLIEQGSTKLAIPLLGAGLDRLPWNESRAFILELFEDTEITIIVCIK